MASNNKSEASIKDCGIVRISREDGSMSYITWEAAIHTLKPFHTHTERELHDLLWGGKTFSTPFATYFKYESE